MALIKKYRWTLGLLFITGIISLYKIELGGIILNIAGSNLKTLFMLIPPIFILIGLLDVWVPKESMMKHMGEDSGAKGLFYSFMLGTIALGYKFTAIHVFLMITIYLIGSFLIEKIITKEERVTILKNIQLMEG